MVGGCLRVDQEHLRNIGIVGGRSSRCPWSCSREPKEEALPTQPAIRAEIHFGGRQAAVEPQMRNLPVIWFWGASKHFTLEVFHCTIALATEPRKLGLLGSSDWVLLTIYCADLVYLRSHGHQRNVTWGTRSRTGRGEKCFPPPAMSLQRPLWTKPDVTLAGKG